MEQALEQHPEMGWAILHRANLGFQIWYIPAPNRTALLSDWDGLEKNYAWMLEQQEIYAALKDGSLHVFDTSAFTVDGKELDTYKKGDTEYISDGYFHESEYGSAPAFDIAIDGITSITE